MQFAYMKQADSGYLQSVVAMYRGKRPEFLSTSERAERDAAIAELILRGELNGL